MIWGVVVGREGKNLFPKLVSIQNAFSSQTKSPVIWRFESFITFTLAHHLDFFGCRLHISYISYNIRNSSF